MKCQSLLSGKNKKNVTNLLSAEYVQTVVKVRLKSKSEMMTSWVIHIILFSYFSLKTYVVGTH